MSVVNVRHGYYTRRFILNILPWCVAYYKLKTPCDTTIQEGRERYFCLQIRYALSKSCRLKFPGMIFFGQKVCMNSNQSGQINILISCVKERLGITYFSGREENLFLIGTEKATEYGK